MKEFWVRVVSLTAVVLALVGYNTVLDAREKDDQIAQLTAQLNQNTKDGTTESDGAYKDGTYSGEADGFGGTIQVEVKIASGKISEVNVVSAEKEDGAYLEMAKDIIPKIVEAQNWDVDTISGATFSSTGIKNATQNALEKAVQ